MPLELPLVRQPVYLISPAASVPVFYSCIAAQPPLQFSVRAIVPASMSGRGSDDENDVHTNERDIMRAFMEVVITKPGGGVRTVKKEVDLPFAPAIGMSVWCQAWKDTRKVKDVSLCFDPDDYEASLWIGMETEETRNAEEQERLVEQYKGHGWSVIGE